MARAKKPETVMASRRRTKPPETAASEASTPAPVSVSEPRAPAPVLPPLISGLTAGWSIEKNLKVGDCEVATLAPSLAGHFWLRPAHEPTDTDVVSFNLGAPADVCVVYVSNKPEWLSSWPKIPMTLEGGRKPCKVRKKSFPAGLVVLGPVLKGLHIMIVEGK